jgi:hemoglobin
MERTTATTKKAMLYERLGGETGVRKIVNDVLDKHAVNPVLAHHFQNIDMKKLKQLVFEFFSMGTGGPHSYTGRDMRTSHKGMNITEKEWESATEDTIWAMDTNGVAEAEKNEVLTILDSLKGEIVGV